MIRTNQRRDTESWLTDLRAHGLEHDRAILDLRDYLLRAIIVYVSRHRRDLSRFDHDELRQMSEDWAQRAVIKILDQLAGFRGESKFTTWAYRVAINLVAGDLRRKRWGDISLEGMQESASGDPRMLIKDDGPSPESELTRDGIWQAVLRTIEEDLTERQRTVIKRVVLEDASVEDVAQALGTNRNNVYKLLHDARQKLKRSLLARHWSAEEVLAVFGSNA